jgi:hypothetical protein
VLGFKPSGVDGLPCHPNYVALMIRSTKCRVMPWASCGTADEGMAAVVNAAALYQTATSLTQQHLGCRTAGGPDHLPLILRSDSGRADVLVDNHATREPLTGLLGLTDSAAIHLRLLLHKNLKASSSTECNPFLRQYGILPVCVVRLDPSAGMTCHYCLCSRLAAAVRSRLCKLTSSTKDY